MAKKEKQQTGNVLVKLLEKHGMLDVTAFINNFNRVERERLSWESQWKIIQDYTYPNYKDYTVGNSLSAPLSGGVSKSRNYDAFVVGKIAKVVAQLYSQLVDPSVQWMELKFKDPCYLIDGTPIKLSNSETAKRWLYEVKDSLYATFADPDSNFYASSYSFYYDWFTLGTSCREVIIRKDTGKIRFNTISMKAVFIELGGYGDIDVVYRTMNLSAKQAIDLYGQQVHESTMRELQMTVTGSNTSHKYVEICVPNMLVMKYPMMPSYLVYTIDIKNKHLVDVRATFKNPYIIARFETSPGEVYGRSCVWAAMPDIVILNRMSKRAVQNADFSTNPPFLVKDTTSLLRNMIVPGGFIPGLDARGNASIQPLPLGQQFNSLMEFIKIKHQSLDETLLVNDVFPPMTNNMTAEEVSARRQQAATRVRPLLSRLEREDLNQTINRVYSLLLELNAVPMFPYEQVEKELGFPQRGILVQMLPDLFRQVQVVFSGPMAKVQAYQEIEALENLFNKVLQLAQYDQRCVDWLKPDLLIVKMKDVLGVDPKVLSTMEEVVEARRIRAEQQEQQAQLQQINDIIEGASKMKQVSENE